MSEKIIVNGMWLGGRLTHLEMMTMQSFTSFGHQFNLWHYHDLDAKLPNGVVACDGNEILPKDMIFRYPPVMMLGFGHNSYVGFSELFRYKVLYEIGGWWSDMDVTCLKPLDLVTDDYWFRNHGVLSVVGNIMKAPPKSELMKLCFDRAVVEVNAQQDDWHHAIRILCYYIEYLGLSKYIHRDLCNLDRLDRVLPYLQQDLSLKQLPENWMFIHWMNSVIDKFGYKKGSIFEQLLHKHSYQGSKLFI